MNSANEGADLCLRVPLKQFTITWISLAKRIRLGLGEVYYSRHQLHVVENGAFRNAGLLVVAGLDCGITVHSPSRKGRDKAIEAALGRQHPRVMITATIAREKNGLLEGFREVASRIDFGWCVAQKLKLDTKRHVFHDRRLTSSEVKGSE